jgi:hypothetical protein
MLRLRTVKDAFMLGGEVVAASWRYARTRGPWVLAGRGVFTQRCQADAWPGVRMTNAASPEISLHADWGENRVFTICVTVLDGSGLNLVTLNSDGRKNVCFKSDLYNFSKKLLKTQQDHKAVKLTLQNSMVNIYTICFNNHILNILPVERIYGFLVLLRINSNFFLNSLNQLIVLMERGCVFFEVGAEFLTSFRRASCIKVLNRLHLSLHNS